MSECEGNVAEDVSMLKGKLLLEEIRSKRKTKRNKSTSKFLQVGVSAQVSPTQALLTVNRIAYLRRIWLEVRQSRNVMVREDETKDEAINSSAGDSIDRPTSIVQIPNFKVGSLEMYRRFPLVYDYFMRHHDCSAIEQYLHGVLTALQKGTSRVSSDVVDSATSCGGGEADTATRKFSVADFGCGTGRIGCMLSKHSSVGALYCYDSETAMLFPCVENIVRSVAMSRTDVDGVYIVPNGDTPFSAEPNDCLYIGDGCGGGEDNINNVGGCRSVKLCVRPYSFNHVQRGVLQNHARCKLIVCAWSLSYVMRACWGADRWHAAVDETIECLLQLLETEPETSSKDCEGADECSCAAALVVIETLGTNTTSPTRQNTLLERLETHHGFERRWVRTDYNFRDTSEAVQLTRFFFGENMAQIVSGSGSTVLPECTGIWTRWRK